MSSIKDVARVCGVSTATVSRIINNHPGAATAETRERVLQAIRRMNYRPSAVARGLTRQRMNTLGIVLVGGNDFILAGESYYSRILDGVLATNRRRNQKTLLFFEKGWREAYENLPSYYDGHCDGLILMTPVVKEDFFETLHNHSVPFVVTGGMVVDEDVSSAAMDDADAGLKCTQYLLEQGHRRIAHFCGESGWASSELRLQGYRMALEEAGIPLDESLILAGEYSDGSGYQRTKTLLSRPVNLRPTAVFCADDAIAFGALRALRESEVKVPTEISVIGINDALGDIWTQPALTSFRQPYHEIGQRLVEILLTQIEKRMPAGLHETIQGQLVVRASVTKPPAIEL